MNTEVADKVISSLRPAKCCRGGTEKPGVVMGRMLVDRNVVFQEAYHSFMTGNSPLTT